MNIYTIIESASKKTIFFYAIIILFFIYFFRSKQIGLNVFLAILLSVSVIIYLYQRDEVKHESEQKIHDTKLKAIKPPTTYFADKNDIIDFFFSVQDFYVLNPQVYEDVIDNVDSFLNIHRIIHMGVTYPNDYYEIAKDKKEEALNSFQALIYVMPDDDIMLDKFNRGHRRLETLLNKYLNEMYDICNNDLIMKGYNIYIHPINTGPDGYNKECDETMSKIEKDYSFKFY